MAEVYVYDMERNKVDAGPEVGSKVAGLMYQDEPSREQMVSTLFVEEDLRAKVIMYRLAVWESRNWALIEMINDFQESN